MSCFVITFFPPPSLSLLQFITFLYMFFHLVVPLCASLSLVLHGVTCNFINESFLLLSFPRSGCLLVFLYRFCKLMTFVNFSSFLSSSCSFCIVLFASCFFPPPLITWCNFLLILLPPSLLSSLFLLLSISIPVPFHFFVFYPFSLFLFNCCRPYFFSVYCSKHTTHIKSLVT